MAAERRDKSARQAAWRSGRRAEWLAAMYLRLKGYRLLARNVATPYGEIDLVMRRGNLVTFVEVKRRAEGGEPGGAVTWNQQQRIARAVRHLAGLKRFGGPDDGIRIDVVLMAPGRWPQHMTDAWRP